MDYIEKFGLQSQIESLTIELEKVKQWKEITLKYQKRK